MAAAHKLSKARVAHMLTYATKHGRDAAARRYRVSANAVYYHQSKGRNSRSAHSRSEPEAGHTAALEAISLLRKAIACRPTDNALHPYDAYVVLALDTLQGGMSKGSARA